MVVGLWYTARRTPSRLSLDRELSTAINAAVEHLFRKRQIRSRCLGFQRGYTALDETASKSDHAVVQVQILPLETKGLADARTEPA